MEPLYTAVVTATQGRQGHLESEDSSLKLPLAMPKALGGPGGDGTNPEQLFAAGYAACFGSAVQLVARQQKLVLDSVAITAKVHIGKSGAGFGLAVELTGDFGKLPHDQADSLMKAAHKVCPYSLATANNIEVKLHTA